jgi:glycosyltransferase involved in cell wall biosynthesis
MRIAIVTPWPNDKSGIADYAYDLVQGLIRKTLAITVFTRAEHPKELEGCEVIANENFDEWDLSEFDIIIYHLGNNNIYHSHMMRLLKKFPGIVHLHDFVLHHLVAGVASETDDWQHYFDTFKKFYGEDEYIECKKKWDEGCYAWENKNIIDYPLNEEYLEHSNGVIIHSNFAHDKVRSSFPLLPLKVIPQVYKMNTQLSTHSTESEMSLFRIGVFGHVQPNKCIDVIISALATLELINKNIVINIIGSISDSEYYKKLRHLLEPIKGNVTLECSGHVSEKQFIKEIASCDLCIALRNPTMGETSAVVMRALQFGKPIVVNNTGWYAELPDFVKKISTGTEGVIQLGEYLDNMIFNSKCNKGVCEKTLQFSKAKLCFETVSNQYLRSIFEFYQLNSMPSEQLTVEELIIESISTIFVDLNLQTSKDESALRAGIYHRLIALI